MKRLFPYAALCFALLISAKAAAATSARIFELMPANEFKRILADLNLTGEIDKDGDVTVKLENHTVLVLIGSYQGQVIQFRYSSTAKATLRQINDWNIKRKFCKAYLDNDGEPALDMDLDLEGGVTEARIKDAIKTYSELVGMFIQHLKDSN